MFLNNIFRIPLTNGGQCCIIYKVNIFGFDRAKGTRGTDLQRAAVRCKAVAVRNIELSLEPSTERLDPSRKNGLLPLQRRHMLVCKEVGLISSQSEWYRENFNFVSVVLLATEFFYFYNK